MSPDNDDAAVSYTVRELLDRIDRQQTQAFARIETSMATKADKADVAQLKVEMRIHGERLTRVDDRVTMLEAGEHDRRIKADVHVERDQRVLTVRQKAWAALSAIALLAATILGPYIATHGL